MKWLHSRLKIVPGMSQETTTWYLCPHGPPGFVEGLTYGRSPPVTLTSGISSSGPTSSTEAETATLNLEEPVVAATKVVLFEPSTDGVCPGACSRAFSLVSRRFPASSLAPVTTRMSVVRGSRSRGYAGLNKSTTQDSKRRGMKPVARSHEDTVARLALDYINTLPGDKRIKWIPIKRSGTAALPGGEVFDAAEALIEEMSRVGIHILRFGEIERLDPSIADHGGAWVSAALRKGVHKDDSKLRLLLD